ncbi:MAG: serine protease [Planctomycetota bacterium]
MRPRSCTSRWAERRGTRAGAVSLALASLALGGALARTELRPRSTGVSARTVAGVAPGVAAAPQDLVPGTPVALDLSDGAPQVCRVVVPEDVTGLALQTFDSDGDVEVYVSFGAPPDVDRGDYDIAAENVWFEEALVIEVSDVIALEAGAWYIAVVPANEGTTRSNVRAEFLRPASHRAVVGEVLDFELARANGLRANVALDLPVPRPSRGAGPTRWLVEVFSPTADVDVSVSASGFLSGFEDRYGWGGNFHSYERFHVEVPRFRRSMVLEVFGYQASEGAARVPVRVLVQRDEAPESVAALDICPVPTLAGPGVAFAASPFDSAARATVLVHGPYGTGSGVVVHPSGYVLSCAHVLVGSERVRDPEGALPAIAIGFTLDPKVIPVAAFGAELVELRQDLDLALVRITGDLLGRPLARSPLGANVAFPTLELAARPPLMGERMVGFGYPITGGTSSMVTLTLTSGWCSGFSREPEGLLLKTDAIVHSGDSGGPFVDVEGRLIGIAVASLADDDKGGGIGYVVPCALVPEAWRERLGW